MRSKPQKRQVGSGKQYTSMAEFEADLDKWNEEHAARDMLMQQWRSQQDRLRDRSGRVQQSGAQHRRQSAEKQKQDDGARRVRERQEQYERSCGARDALAKAALEKYPWTTDSVCVCSEESLPAGAE